MPRPKAETDGNSEQCSAPGPVTASQEQASHLLLLWNWALHSCSDPAQPARAPASPPGGLEMFCQETVTETLHF